MQSFSCQAPYFCSDCKKQYNSASTLLNHFAKHITKGYGYQTQSSDSEEIDGKQDGLCLPIINDKSILENVLKQTLTCHSLMNYASSSESNNHDSSSSNSDYSNSPSEHDSHLPQPVVELSKQSSHSTLAGNNLMLVKFDLQKRLENCILKLASKRNLALGTSVNMMENSVETTGVTLPLITSKDLTVSVASSSNNNVEHEEFNPLKFCVVTMDEDGDDKLDLQMESPKILQGNASLSASMTKGPSNRKQSSPKKIIIEGKTKPINIDIFKDEKIATKKKYPCLVCCKVFGWSTDLKRHILTHTGERPFKCQHCPATFTRNFLLQKHEMKQHRPSSPNHGTSDHPKSEMPLLNLQSSHSERKRKLQRSITEKIDGIIEKKLGLHQFNPIPVGILSQQALNIS